MPKFVKEVCSSLETTQNLEINAHFILFAEWETNKTTTKCMVTKLNYSKSICNKINSKLMLIKPASNCYSIFYFKNMEKFMK